MKIVNVLAGFSLAQADLLRRAISKKKPEVIEEQKKHFVDGCIKNQIPAAKADKIFQLIMYFAGYGFNKSHSAAYALISYWTAYLKAHYPVEFMTAMLSSEKDNTDKVVQYIDECKRMNLNIMPPDVNESFPRFTVVGKNSIRFGLAAVKNVGQASIDAIIQARIKHGRFKTLYEFTEKVDSRTVNRKTIESLIKCGAYDSLAFKRSQLMEIVDRAINNAGLIQKDRSAGQFSMFDQIGAKTNFNCSLNEIPDIEEWPETERLAYEKELLGFYVTGHPITQYKRTFEKHSDTSIETIGARLDGEEVLMGALINKLKFTTTKKTNERMAIMTLEDLHGTIEALMFPRVHQVYGKYAIKDAVYFFKGRVSKKEDEPKLIIQEIYPVSEMQNRMTRSVMIEVRASESTEEKLHGLQEILSHHSGQTPVYLRFVEDNGSTNDMLIDRTFFALPNDELMEDVESFMGAGSIHFQT